MNTPAHDFRQRQTVTCLTLFRTLCLVYSVNTRVKGLVAHTSTYLQLTLRLFCRTLAVLGWLHQILLCWVCCPTHLNGKILTTFFRTFPIASLLLHCPPYYSICGSILLTVVLGEFFLRFSPKLNMSPLYSRTDRHSGWRMRHSDMRHSCMRHGPIRSAGVRQCSSSPAGLHGT